MKPTYIKTVCLSCLPYPCCCDFGRKHPNTNFVDLKTAIRETVGDGDVVEGDPDGFAGFFDKPDDDYDDE